MIKPTPETDEIYRIVDRLNYEGRHVSANQTLLEHARKIERERDDARQALAATEIRRENAARGYVDARNELERVQRFNHENADYIAQCVELLKEHGIEPPDDGTEEGGK